MRAVLDWSVTAQPGVPELFCVSRLINRSPPSRFRSVSQIVSWPDARRLQGVFLSAPTIPDAWYLSLLTVRLLGKWPRLNTALLARLRSLSIALLVTIILRAPGGKGKCITLVQISDKRCRHEL